MTSELWLSVDLSGAIGSIALHRFDGQRSALVAEAVLDREVTHSEKLIPTLDACLSSAGMALSAVARFVTTSGPGSFTGLRIAYASLKGFALAGNVPIETVSASEARGLAFAATRSDLGPGDRVIVVTGVSRDRFARAILGHDGSQLRLTEESVTTPETLFPSGGGRVIALLDDKTSAALFSDRPAETIAFPLRARHLGETLPRAATRTTHVDLPAWIAASPHYFGETRYRTTF